MWWAEHSRYGKREFESLCGTSNESKTGIKTGDFYFPSICLNFRTILSFLEFPSFILFLVLEAKPMSLIHTSSPAQTSESQDRAFNLQFYGGVGAFLNLAPMLP